MLLKNHLNFWGDKETNQIRFHSISNPKQDLIIEVDYFDAVWEYLVLLSQAHTAKIECWQHKYNISSEQKDAYDAFLVASRWSIYLKQTHRIHVWPISWETGSQQSAMVKVTTYLNLRQFLF